MKAMTCEAAVAELKNNAGSQFDPEVVAVFLRHLKEKEYCRNGGQDDYCSSPGRFCRPAGRAGEAWRPPSFSAATHGLIFTHGWR
ncbi:hypothetical protein MHOCP_06430 [Moorella humiferrea]|uniref:hypothetical protein n=1 Tax=Neomoorella humiferrea TaxID=676965 RepID=UPI0030D028C4